MAKFQLDVFSDMLKKQGKARQKKVKLFMIGMKALEDDSPPLSNNALMVSELFNELYNLSSPNSIMDTTKKREIKRRLERVQAIRLELNNLIKG